eukprot:GHVN01003888.1.p1 GENE.GHVN01003888.1~~GHVN01003888.1.p1  ORF type:complete len:353 (+),score=27.32 GHVN01003888.1:163-1221(+)
MASMKAITAAKKAAKSPVFILRPRLAQILTLLVVLFHAPVKVCAEIEEDFADYFENVTYIKGRPPNGGRAPTYKRILALYDADDEECKVAAVENIKEVEHISIEGKHLSEKDVRDSVVLPAVLALLKKKHSLRRHAEAANLEATREVQHLRSSTKLSDVSAIFLIDDAKTEESRSAGPFKQFAVQMNWLNNLQQELVKADDSVVETVLEALNSNPCVKYAGVEPETGTLEVPHPKAIRRDMGMDAETTYSVGGAATGKPWWSLFGSDEVSLDVDLEMKAEVGESASTTGDHLNIDDEAAANQYWFSAVSDYRDPPKSVESFKVETAFSARRHRSRFPNLAKSFQPVLILMMP